MKIVIVGAGISGLSTYLHLRKHMRSNHIITIYESHRPQFAQSSTTAPNSLSMSEAPLTLDILSSSTALVGGGLGISPNGMRVLRTLDKHVHDDVAAQGFPAKNFVFNGANGWTLGMQWTGDAKVRKEGEEEEVCIASSRHGLWEILMKKVGHGVVRYGKVVAIERNSDGRVMVKFMNEQGVEESDAADLVVGADGVKSVVRSALFSGDEGFKPRYTGLSGVGGFLNEPIPDFVAKNNAMVFTFGSNGFFGYSSSAPTSSRSLMWWSTFETDTLPATKKIDTAAIKGALVRRHKHWNDPVVQDIVNKAEIQSIYPTWVLGELPNWGENGIVLVGDAAHAMDPTTGQGASQALEDSQTLALLLAECVKYGEQDDLQGREAVALALKLFYQIRNPRVQEIIERGRRIAGRKANVGIVAEYCMYFFLWLLNKFPSFGKLMLGDVNQKLYAWSAEEEVQKAFKALH